MIGNQKIIDFFRKGVVRGNLASAFLFVGPSKIGKRSAAVEAAKIILCLSQKNRPCGKCRACLEQEKGLSADVTILEPEVIESAATKKSAQISIKQIRKARHFLSLSPYLSESKVLIIPECQLMGSEAGAALLKTLEEPPAHSRIILTSSSWREILPTIISRCMVFKFNLVGVKEIERRLKGEGVRNAKELARLSAGRLGLALEYAQNEDIVNGDREAAGQFQKLIDADFFDRMVFANQLSADYSKAGAMLEKWQIFIRDMLLANLGLTDKILLQGLEKSNKYDNVKIVGTLRKINWIQNRMQNPSFNLKLAVEELLVNL